MGMNFFAPQQQKDPALEYQEKSENRSYDYGREQNIVGETLKDQTFLRPQDQQDDLVRWQQDLREELEILRHRLKSEFYDDNTRCWVEKEMSVRDRWNRPMRNEFGHIIKVQIPPLANDMFIDYIETQVEPFLSKNIINSNFDKGQILDMQRDTMDDIADAMVEGHEIYNIEFRNFNLVTRLIKNVIRPAPFRAMNDGERKHIRSFNRNVYAYSETGQKQQEKKRVFGFI